MKQIKPPRVLSYLATLKPRERVLLGACALVFLFVLLEVGVLRPKRMETKRLQQTIELNNTEDIGFASTKRIPLWPVRFGFTTGRPQ